VKTLLEYRDAVKDVYGEDVFVNPAYKVETDENDKPHLTDTRVATDEDYEQAEDLAKQLKSMVDESKTDREFQKMFSYSLK
jgi:phosphoribosylaminoimidazole-succinocarboxamide synthase